MAHSLWSLSIVAFLTALGLAQDQRPPQPPSLEPDITAITVEPLRVGPPPENASAQQLEITADRLRSEKAYNDAIDYYLAALKKTPDSAVLHNKLGIAQLQMQHLDDARKQFQRAAKLDHAYPEPINNLGVVYYLEKKYGKAIKQYEKALRLRQTSASFHSNLGTALFSKKQYEQAALEFHRAMELDPEIFEKQSLTGVGLRMASPEDRARFSYVLAKLCAEQGMFDRSITYLKKAIERGYPGVKEAYQDASFAKLRKDPQFGQIFSEVMAQRETLPN